MDCEPINTNQNKVVEKLNKTTKRIQKSRKNLKIAEKETAEFQEIHKLLHNVDDDLLPTITKPEPSPVEIKTSDKYYTSIIPAKFPGIKVFHDKLRFSLFKEHNCELKNFLKKQDKCLIFGKNETIPAEDCFRKLIAYHVADNLMPEEDSCSSICLYVLYLMSVHPDAEFVTSCFDFLTQQKPTIQLEDIFPVFINFGADDLFYFDEKAFRDKFPGKNAAGENSGFPFFNVEMVGRIILQYITENRFVIGPNIKCFIQGLVKITLDPKIRSGFLLPLYSTILSTFCSKIHENYSLEEIASWIHTEEEHLFNQLEICRNVSRPVFSDLHDILVLKVLSQILKPDVIPARPPIKINHVKTILRKLKRRELLPLELYSLLQLINSSLPGLTATVKDSTEINTLLACLERKINKIEDSVDLIRLKLEVAKVGNLVTNNITDRFAIQEISTRSKKVKCSK